MPVDLGQTINVHVDNADILYYHTYEVLTQEEN
jgi:hypothetical protein